jgi:hypothetical protein
MTGVRSLCCSPPLKSGRSVVRNGDGRMSDRTGGIAARKKAASARTSGNASRKKSGTASEADAVTMTNLTTVETIERERARIADR